MNSSGSDIPPPPQPPPPPDENASGFGQWNAAWSAVSQGVAGPTAPDIPASVLDSKPCLSCGYDLKGLSSAGVCPECNAPVLRSLQGDLLQYASLGYLKTLKQGCLIVEISFAASIILGGLGIAGAISSAALLGSARAGEFIAAGAEALGATIGLLGWWIFSSQDPGLTGEDVGANARKILRIALIGAAVTALVKLCLVFVPGFSQALRNLAVPTAAGGVVPSNPSGNGKGGYISFGGLTTRVGGGASLWPAILMGSVGLLSLALTITKFFASMLYLRGIVRRMPDPAIEVHVKRFMWLGPLLYTVGIALCGLGPIIAFIMNWVIVDKARQRLNSITDQHVDRGPVPAS